MKFDATWVPMKLACGPLDLLARGTEQDSDAGPGKAADAGLKDTLAAWAKPEALQIIEGTPVNCLVVNWAAGVPEDAAQQAIVKPLVEAGKSKGIIFVAKITAKDPSAAIASAQAAGFAAVISGSAGTSGELPSILSVAHDSIKWDQLSPIFCATGNEWPGIKSDNTSGDTAVAGPTGAPWVNSNAAFSLLAAKLAPGKTVWLDFDPPAESTLEHPADYALAVADSEVYGSHWVVSLDDQLRAGLVKGDPKATETWKKLTETLAFYVKHREWQTYRPQGVLTVISSFTGDDAFISNETMNLLNRRHVQFKVMPRSEALLVPMPGEKALLWTDKAKPTAEQLAKALDFVRHGGLLIAPAYWGPAGVTPGRRDPSILYQVYNVGQGQIAVPDEGFNDPYQVALDTQLLVSRRNDLARLYNPATTNVHCSFDPVHQRRLVQVVNYVAAPADYITVWVNTRERAARYWHVGDSEPTTIKGVSAPPGTDFGLPTLKVSCGLELEV
jgi:hypothetical protein